MSGYQSFPYRTGASNSPGKLTRLYLPPLAGRSFLDVGCNEGYFCGFAFFDGAAKAVGIDIREDALTTARRLFPNANSACKIGAVSIPMNASTLFCARRPCITRTIRKR